MVMLQKGFVLCWVWVFLAVGPADICGQDPCSSDNVAQFEESGCRNPQYTNLSSICDFYLQEGWYKTPNSNLVNSCTPARSCGVDYPTWLNGTFPDEADGIVRRNACTFRDGDCCKDIIPINVKNCSGYYIYYLRPLKQCPSAYCFESDLPCHISSTTVQPRPSSTSPALIINPKAKSTAGPAISEPILIVILVVVILIVIIILIVAVIWIKTQRCQKFGQSRVGTPPHIPMATIQVAEKPALPPSYEESQKRLK